MFKVTVVVVWAVAYSKYSKALYIVVHLIHIPVFKQILTTSYVNYQAPKSVKTYHHTVNNEREIYTVIAMMVFIKLIRRQHFAEVNLDF